MAPPGFPRLSHRHLIPETSRPRIDDSLNRYFPLGSRARRPPAASFNISVSIAPSSVLPVPCSSKWARRIHCFMLAAMRYHCSLTGLIAILLITGVSVYFTISNRPVGYHLARFNALKTEAKRGGDPNRSPSALRDYLRLRTI